jgi:hypothetical protein
MDRDDRPCRACAFDRPFLHRDAVGAEVRDHFSSASTLFSGVPIFKFGNDSVTASATRGSNAGRTLRVSAREIMHCPHPFSVGTMRGIFPFMERTGSISVHAHRATHSVGGLL